MMILNFLFEWVFWFNFILWSLCIALFGITIYLCIIYTHLRAFPTSPFIPIFGHVFDYIDPYKSLTILTNNLLKYGGVLRQYIGPQKPSLIVGDRDFLEFLCNNNKHVCKSKFYDYLKPWLGEGLITSDGDKWLSRRKALTGSFTQTSQLISFVEIFEQKSDILVSILNTHHNKEVNLHPIMKRFTLDVICETAMGIALNSQQNPYDSSYAKSIEDLCEIAQGRMTSFLKNFDFFFQFSDDCVREKKALATVENMLEEIISQKSEENIKSKGKKVNRDMLDLLMDIEIDGKGLKRSDLREEINTFTFAGYDTTSSAMALALYEIAKFSDVQLLVMIGTQRFADASDRHYPELKQAIQVTVDYGLFRNYLNMYQYCYNHILTTIHRNIRNLNIEVNGVLVSLDVASLFSTHSAPSRGQKLEKKQKKLLEEQRSIFKKDFKTAKNTFETLNEMTYLEMVIKETLRLHTIVPAVGKRITKELKYGNKKIPSMLNFSIFIHGFHHNPKYFPDPDKFHPERFADKVDSLTYMPFGVKPRQCLGKNFAMLEMKCVISKIIRNFEIIQIPDHNLKLLPKLVLFSSSGIWVKLRRRSTRMISIK